MDIGKHHPAMDLTTVWSGTLVTAFIPISALVGIAFALHLWIRVAQIKVGGGAAVRSENGREYLLEEEQRGESEVRAAPGSALRPPLGPWQSWQPTRGRFPRGVGSASGGGPHKRDGGPWRPAPLGARPLSFRALATRPD